MSKRTQAIILWIVSIGLLVSMVVAFTPMLGSIGGATLGQNNTEPVLYLNGEPLPELELLRTRQNNRIYSLVSGGEIGDDLQTMLIDDVINSTLLQEAAKDTRVGAGELREEVNTFRENNNVAGRQNDQNYLNLINRIGFRSDEEFRSYMREQVRMRKYLESLAEDITVSDSEIEEYYDLFIDSFKGDDRIKARQLVVADEALAQELRASLVAGADFIQLVEAYSTEGADKGGAVAGSAEALEPVTRLALPTPLADAAFRLQGVGLTEVVSVAGRHYLISVEELLEGEPKPLEEVREDIRETLENNKRAAAREKALEDLRSSAEIVSPEDTLYPYNNDVLATVADEEITRAELARVMYSDQQIQSFVQRFPDFALMQKPGFVNRLIEEELAYRGGQEAEESIVGPKGLMARAASERIMREAGATDEELNAYYEANKDSRFTNPAQAIATRVTFESEEEAQAFREALLAGEIAVGEGFEEALQPFGGVLEELGDVGAGTVTPEALDEALFGEMADSQFTVLPDSVSRAVSEVVVITEIAPEEVVAFEEESEEGTTLEIEDSAEDATTETEPAEAATDQTVEEAAEPDASISADSAEDEATGEVTEPEADETSASDSAVEETSEVTTETAEAAESDAATETAETEADTQEEAAEPEVVSEDEEAEDSAEEAETSTEESPVEAEAPSEEDAEVSDTEAGDTEADDTEAGDTSEDTANTQDEAPEPELVDRYVVLLAVRTPEIVRSFEQVKPQVEQAVLQENRGDLLRTWLDELRAEVDVTNTLAPNPEPTDDSATAEGTAENADELAAGFTSAPLADDEVLEGALGVDASSDVAPEDDAETEEAPSEEGTEEASEGDAEAEEVSSEEPVEEASAETSEGDAEVEEVVAEEGEAEEASVEEAAEEAPAEETPAEEVAEGAEETEEATEEEASAEEVSEGDAETEEAPSEEVVEEASAEEAPSEEAPVEEAPEGDADAEEAPSGETSEEVAPDETTSEEVPAEEVPAEEAISEEAPTEEVTEESATPEAASEGDTEEAPSEEVAPEASAEEATSEETTSEEAPVEEAPEGDAEAEEAPSEEVSEEAVEEAPAEEATSEDVSEEAEEPTETASEGDAEAEETTSEEAVEEAPTEEATEEPQDGTTAESEEPAPESSDAATDVTSAIPKLSFENMQPTSSAPEETEAPAQEAVCEASESQKDMIRIQLNAIANAEPAERFAEGTAELSAAYQQHVKLVISAVLQGAASGVPVEITAGGDQGVERADAVKSLLDSTGVDISCVSVLTEDTTDGSIFEIKVP